ncbi:MAG TPA: glycosyltransferase family protein [Vicinamibacterales bacterium]|nr:glycosyltransferase family protein [Vicinamibacterales bacterium]
MRVVATIESRMGSTRLPGKNAKPLAGHPMLARLIERVRAADMVDTVCVATTSDPSDDPLEAIARGAGAEVFRGSTDDVLGRVLGAARSVSADVIVEITGDCPLVDPSIVDAAVRRYAAGGADYVANILDVLSFPIGFDVQVFAVDLLDEVSRLTDDPGDRVDVTPYIHRHPDRYRLLNLRAPAELDRPEYFLCVDYPEDFEVVSHLFEALYPTNPRFGAREVIPFLDARPELARLNTGRPGLFTFPSSGGAARQEVMVL